MSSAGVMRTEEEWQARERELLTRNTELVERLRAGGGPSDTPERIAKRIRQEYMPWDEFPSQAGPGGVADRLEAAIAEAIRGAMRKERR